jgi:hypothetical protein
VADAALTDAPVAEALEPATTTPSADAAEPPSSAVAEAAEIAVEEPA